MAAPENARADDKPQGTGSDKMPSRSIQIALGAVLVLALLLRYAMLHKFGIIAEPDTAQYKVVAEGIRRGDLSGDPGFRVPGFPLLMAIAGMSSKATVAIQILLALISLVLLFSASRFLLKNDRAALILTGAYAICPMFAQYDISLLSESFSTSLAIAAFWGSVQFVKSERIGWLAFAAVFAALATLTRPNLVVLSAILPFWAYLAFKAPKDIRLKRFAVAFLPALVFLGGWSAYNKSRLGVFNITTIGGFAMTNITGDIMADMPKGEGPLFDTYVATSNAYKQQTGSRLSAVWIYIDSLQKAAGKPLPQASQEMMQYDIKAIKFAPARYAKTLVSSYAAYWGAPGIIPFHPDSAASRKTFATLPHVVVSLEQGGSRIMRYLLFIFMILVTWYLLAAGSEIKMPLAALIGIPVLLLVCLGIKHEATGEVLSISYGILAPISLTIGLRKGKSALVLLIAALSWMMSLASSIPDFGSSRYGAPIAPFIFLGLAYCLLRVRSTQPKNNQALT